MAQQVTFSPGDRVCFNAQVIHRAAHNPNVVAFVGTVGGLYCHGKVAEVQTVDGLRVVPTANLAKVTRHCGIVDPTL